MCCSGWASGVCSTSTGPSRGLALTPTALCCWHLPGKVSQWWWPADSHKWRCETSPCWALLTSGIGAKGWDELLGCNGGGCSAPYWGPLASVTPGRGGGNCTTSSLPPTPYSELLMPDGSQGSALSGSYNHQQRLWECRLTLPFTRSFNLIAEGSGSSSAPSWTVWLINGMNNCSANQPQLALPGLGLLIFYGMEAQLCIEPLTLQPVGYGEASCCCCEGWRPGPCSARLQPLGEATVQRFF